MNETRELTFGEKAVGITFNPGGDEKVNKVKQKFADVIDLLNDLPGTNPIQITERELMIKEAIRQCQTAQMWAVKVITWPYKD